MVRCAAYNCTGVGKSLFRFPTDRDLLKRWLANLKREDFRPNDHSRLCQDHFESPCFERNPDLMEITGAKFKLSLKPDAVPTKFCFGEPKLKSHQKGKRAYLTSKLQPRLSPTKCSPTRRIRSGSAYHKRRRLEVRTIFLSICVRNYC